MFAAQLEERLQKALDARGEEVPRDSLVFAADFARLLARILPPRDISEEDRETMIQAIRARTELSDPSIGSLLDLALAPETRSALSEDDLRTFSARFGQAEGAALRAAAADELDLEQFAERYGSAEALLLLDALFSVCASNQTIDPQEVGRLVHAADRLGIDPMLVGALFRKHDSRYAAGDLSFTMDESRYVIGRDPTCDITLPDPQVARRHAELVRSATGWRIVDLGSGRPTLLNGNPIQSSPFQFGDDCRVGSYRLAFDEQGVQLSAKGATAFSALSVRGLTRTIQGISLLDDVSFTVFSGEVIAVVGPSGAGKTTLLNAIAGVAPADTGDVILDGQDFHGLLANDRSLVGIVPQDDVIHGELTVRESLRFSGKLRFPSGVSGEDLEQEVDRVLRELDIEHIHQSRIGSVVKRGISGGQRKRVNLGQELLTRSTRVLFLDEPTSGLDPQTAQDIVGLVRQLADDGRIVFLVTHDVTPSILAMVDHLMVLAPGGRLAWFGPPQDACDWFKVESPDAVFARLPDSPPETWGHQFKEGHAFKKFVRTREHLLGLDGVSIQRGAATNQRIRHSTWGQFTTLTRRYAKVKFRDTAGLAILLAQAPILAFFMYIVFPAPDPAQLFMLELSALWFGASGSVRELIAERPIWRREARVGLKPLSYLGSKVAVLGTLALVQCVVLVGMNHVLLEMGSETYGFSLLALLGVTTLTAWVGTALGLLISATLSSSEAAVGTLPLILIPQITFGGLIVKVKEMGLAAKLMSYLMVVRYSFEAAINTGEQLTDPARGGQERVARNITGHLYNLGFKSSSSADDMGIAFPILVGVLFGTLVVLLVLTLWFTSRSREGN
jgi:ABC-type multidrug transport system ATPase subunit